MQRNFRHTFPLPQPPPPPQQPQFSNHPTTNIPHTHTPSQYHPLPSPRYPHPPVPPNIPHQSTIQAPPAVPPPRECVPWQCTPPPVPQCYGTVPQMKGEGTVLNREEEDEKWMIEFEMKVKDHPPPPPLQPPFKRHTKNVKLCDVQQMLVESHALKEELCGLEEQLIEVSGSANDGEWSQLVRKTEITKENLKKNLDILRDPELVKHTQALLKQRRAKRSRVKRRKRRRQEEREELERKRKEEEAEIDAWRAKVKREEDAKRREEAVKREADSVLGEVRHKQSESEKVLQLLEALAGLRNTRAVQAVAQGLPRDTHAEERFKHTTEMLARVVKSQLKEYELEEQTLRVMMEESASHRSAALNAKGDANFARYKDGIRRMLFGPTSTQDSPHDTKHSMETLIQRRSQWDQFVADDDDNPLASSVPLSWVIPT